MHRVTHTAAISARHNLISRMNGLAHGCSCAFNRLKKKLIVHHLFQQTVCLLKMVAYCIHEAKVI
jgi:hypothetical protein